MSLRGLGMQPRQPLCEPLVGSRSLLLHRPWNLRPRKFCISTLENMYAAIRVRHGLGINSDDAGCKLRHKRTRDHARRRPHRTNCHPLVIHLAPIDGMLCCGPAAKRSATQNRTKRRPATINPLPLLLQRSAVSRVHTTASTRSSHHGTMSNDTSQLPMRCAMSATRVDTSSLTSSMSEA